VVRTWLARGDGERAVSSAQLLLERYPEEILAHTLLADAYDLVGNRDGRRRAIQGALDMSGRIVWFDQTQRERFQTEMRRLLSSAP
jgi:Flp pilus assembly protein TadD